MNPFLIMGLLYLALAALVAVDASLTSWNILEVTGALRWLRIHFITIGAVTQALFGLMPLIATARSGLPRPAVRWDIWLIVNTGLIVLLVGIPLVNEPLIIAGGVLVAVAAALLVRQLLTSRVGPGQRERNDSSRFFVVGLAYLLLGVLIGTGLWLGWSGPLRVAVPIEVHIHANNWGFLSMVFAGLLIEIYPRVTGRSFAWPGSTTAIFWLMTAGALGLVLGPWTQSNLFSVPGLLMHLTATIWLVLNVVRPIWSERKRWTPGMWHLTTSYIWILAPVLVAPLIITGVPGFPGIGIEQNAPQALIYGWVLQFSFAVMPYLFARTLLPDEPAELGGSWLSLAAVHAGAIVLWASIFLTGLQSELHGLAYALWAIATVPILQQMAQILLTARKTWRPVATG